MDRRRRPRATRLERGNIPHPRLVVGVKCALSRRNAMTFTGGCENTISDIKSKSMDSKTFERTDRVIKIYVDLCPVLASAKEPMEEEDNGSWGERESVTSTDNLSTVHTSKSGECQLREQRRLHRDPISDRAKVTQLVKTMLLTPINKPCSKQPTYSVCLGTSVSHTPLPQINVSEQGAMVKSPKRTKPFENEAPFPRILLQKPNTSAYTMLSQCGSPPLHLPEMSVSSIDALLQGVAEHVGRKERKSDHGTWGLTCPDHLLMALRYLRERRIQHQTDYRTEEQVRCPEVKPIKSVSGQKLITEQKCWDPASLRNGSKLPVILSMAKRNF